MSEICDCMIRLLRLVDNSALVSLVYYAAYARNRIVDSKF
ncbi:hypothetical protein VPMS16_1029 [Vibrio sp. 16]|nr:hypothetical protein VPMS16_1029 [Vibrio sp. 16]